AVGELGGDQLVAIVDSHRDDSTGPYVCEFGELGLLDCPLPSRHHHILAFYKLADRNNRRELFFSRYVQEVDDGFAAARGGRVGNLMDLELVDLTLVGEDHHICV